MGGIYRILDAISGLFSFSGLTGCVSEGVEDANSCLSDDYTAVPAYHYNTPHSSPATNYPYTDPNRQPAVWHIYGVANCDGSVDNLGWVSNYPGATITAVLNAQGTYDLTISSRFENDPSANPDNIRIRIFNTTIVSPADAANFSQTDTLGLREVTLYLPTPAAVSGCVEHPAPTIRATQIDSDPDANTEAVVGQPIRFSVLAELVRQCDGTNGTVAGNTLVASFIIDSTYYQADFDAASGEYYIDWVYDAPQTTRVIFEVTDSAHPQSDNPPAIDSGWFYVNTATRAVGQPPACIVAPLSGEVNTDITFTSAGADETLYTYSWYFIGSPPEEDRGPSVRHRFNAPGTYQVRLTVATLDGSQATVMTQNITIVTPGVETPNLSFTALPSVAQSASFTMQIDSPDPNFTYTWNMGTTTLTGSSITYSFDTPGQKAVILSASPIAHPEISFVAPAYFIYVTPTGRPVPTLSLLTPDFARVGDLVHISIASPDLTNFEYFINYGTGDIAGVELDHAFSAPGIYSVTMTARLRSDRSVVYTLPMPRTITIGETAVPLPSLVVAHNPPTGRGSGYNFTFDASASYSTVPGATITSYEIQYGDGTSATNTTGRFSHAYVNPGAGNNGARTVTLRIVDSNGHENTMSLQVALWGD
jgi:hypothetical protein